MGGEANARPELCIYQSSTLEGREAVLLRAGREPNRKLAVLYSYLDTKYWVSFQIAKVFIKV